LQRVLGDGFVCKSAGTAVMHEDVNRNARIVAGEFGLVLPTIKTTPISKEIIENSDLIICLGSDIYNGLKRSYPEHSDKFLKYAPNIDKVPDPDDLEGFSDKQIKDNKLTKGCKKAYEIVTRMIKDEFTPALLDVLKQKGFEKEPEPVTKKFSASSVGSEKPTCCILS
jgi:protein-tyrosine-phosphatase